MLGHMKGLSSMHPNAVVRNRLGCQLLFLLLLLYREVPAFQTKAVGQLDLAWEVPVGPFCLTQLFPDLSLEVGHCQF